MVELTANFNRSSLTKRFELKFNGESQIKKIFNDLKDIKISRAPSFVNTIYFDTKKLKNLNHSIDGDYPRRQFRYRYYSNNFNINKNLKGFFHIKFSDLTGDEKRYVNLKYEGIPYYLRLSDNENYYPVTLIQYKRYYFYYKFMRITYDTNIRSFIFSNSKLNTPIDYWNNNILEVKIPSRLKQDILNKYTFFKNEWRISKYERSIYKYSLSKNLRI